MIADALKLQFVIKPEAVTFVNLGNDGACNLLAAIAMSALNREGFEVVPIGRVHVALSADTSEIVQRLVEASRRIDDGTAIDELAELRTVAINSALVLHWLLDPRTGGALCKADLRAQAQRAIEEFRARREKPA